MMPSCSTRFVQLEQGTNRFRIVKKKKKKKKTCILLSKSLNHIKIVCVGVTFLVPLSRDNFISCNYWGAAIAQWLERWTRDRKVRVTAGAAGEFSFSRYVFCADSYFGIRFTPVLPQ